MPVGKRSVLRHPVTVTPTEQARLVQPTSHANRVATIKQSGFTYVLVMALVAVVGAGLAAIGPLWATNAQREREAELVRVGLLYAQAIADYRRLAPGSAKPYPPSLDSLVLDNRYVGVKRHLRKLYPDPLMPGRPWGLVRAADGGILGVYSQDEAQPLHQNLADIGLASVQPARRYADWKFVAKEPK
jgi:type II secretory pathway pseudopilin PulG